MTKKTRKQIFLEKMEKVVRWADLEALIAPHYFEGVKGHRFAVQSLPLRGSQPQFDVLLLGNRYENLGKWRWGASALALLAGMSGVAKIARTGATVKQKNDCVE